MFPLRLQPLVQEKTLRRWDAKWNHLIWTEGNSFNGIIDQEIEQRNGLRAGSKLRYRDDFAGLAPRYEQVNRKRFG